jgi:hypothetical protein
MLTILLLQVVAAVVPIMVQAEAVQEDFVQL